MQRLGLRLAWGFGGAALMFGAVASAAAQAPTTGGPAVPSAGTAGVPRVVMPSSAAPSPPAREYYVPVRRYRWVPHWHGRFNPFREPYVAYHLIPETSWERRAIPPSATAATPAYPPTLAQEFGYTLTTRLPNAAASMGQAAANSARNFASGAWLPPGLSPSPYYAGGSWPPPTYGQTTPAPRVARGADEGWRPQTSSASSSYGGVSRMDPPMR